MADQFGASTQQDLRAGGDGKKLYDWRVLNAANAAAIDVNITNTGKLTIASTSNAADPWTENPLSAVIVYQLVTGNFDVETYFSAAANPSAPRCGLICRNPKIVTGENWIELLWASGNGNMARAAVNTSPSQVTTGLNNAYIRMTRVGNVFTLYHKATSGASWTQITQYTRNDMPGVVQLGLFGAQAMTAQFDYFQGTYTLDPIPVSKLTQYGRGGTTDSGVGFLPVVVSESLTGFNPVPLSEGATALYYGSALVLFLTEQLLRLPCAEMLTQTIKHPLVPEIVRYVITEIAEGFNATQTVNTKIVDSGIEALQAIRNSIDTALSTQYTPTTISEGLNLPQHINTKIVDSGIEALQIIRNSIVGINAGQYQMSEIIEGFSRALFLATSASEGITSTQYLPNEMAAYTILTQYLRIVLSQAAVKRIKPQWDITLDGVSIKKYAISIDMTCRESEAIPQIEIALAGLSLYDKCNPIDNYGEARVELTIGGEIYYFFLESRDLSETFGNSSLTIGGRQKSGLLAEGYAEKLTQTYSDKYASAIASEIADNYGVTLSWEADDYWVSSFSADAYPIDAIIQLAEAVGAIVQTTPEGTVIIRPKYPVIPSELSTASIDVAFDRDNITGLDLSEEQALYSKVTVNIKQDDTASYDFSSEVDPTCVTPGSSATIKIYIPNENVTYKLKATPDSKITKTGSGKVETLSETITLKDGSGSTAKAISSVVSYTLYSCDSDNTEIDYTVGSKEITVDDDTCAICEIEYETKYDTWELSCDIEREIAVCLVTYSDDESPSSVTVIMGDGGRAAEDITNDLVFGENQAKTFAEAYLDGNYYRKKKYQLDVPYIGCQTGQIASIADDQRNVYGIGIIREASLSIKLNNDAVEITEAIELYCYEEDGLL